MAPTLAPPYQPRPEWILIEEFAPEPSYLARALELSGAQRFLPASIWQKLRHRNEPSYLYRVTA